MRRRKAAILSAVGATTTSCLVCPGAVQSFAPPAVHPSNLNRRTWSSRANQPPACSSSVVQLNLIRRKPTEKDLVELTDLELSIIDLETKIKKKETNDKLLMGFVATLVVTGIFLFVDGAAFLYAQSDFPYSDVLLAAGRNTPDFVNDLRSAFGFIGDVIGKFLQLFYQVLLVVIPIVVKALYAAGKAAVPAIQKGTVAFLQYLGVAVNDSKEAALPYVSEATKAATPILEQVGSTAKDAASTAGTAVTTKAAEIAEHVSKAATEKAELIRAVEQTASSVAQQTDDISKASIVEEANKVATVQGKAIESAAGQTASSLSQKVDL